MPARGFAYVGASRVKLAERLLYFGKMRRTDWLPVGGRGAPYEQVERSMDSEDTDPEELGGESSAESMDSESMSQHGGLCGELDTVIEASDEPMLKDLGGELYAGGSSSDAGSEAAGPALRAPGRDAALAASMDALLD